uniref:Uncharacterized protein n=1 Tax=Plectus sambesii TaxID=2011161 RepID=A0A914VBR0_9BILA
MPLTVVQQRLHDRREEKDKDNVIDKLQERLAELITENISLENEVRNNVADHNDVIDYLKRTVEKQDDEIARLEDQVHRGVKEFDMKLKTEQDRLFDDIANLTSEVERITTENAILRTQLSNMTHMESELSDLVIKINSLQGEIAVKNAEMARIHADHEQHILAVSDRVKAEMQNEFDKKLIEAANEAFLQMDANAKKMHQINKTLTDEIKDREFRIKILNEKAAEKAEELKLLSSEKQFLLHDNNKLKRQIERSENQTVKAIQDYKRRLEAAEREKTKLFLAQERAENELKTEAFNLNESLRQHTMNLAATERALAKERQKIAQMQESETMLKKELGQLKAFLNNVLNNADEAVVADTFDENRIAVFAKLSHILNKFAL